MIEHIEGMVYNLTSMCSSCVLGQRGSCSFAEPDAKPKRVHGQGPLRSKIMFIAEAPRDTVGDRGPFGLRSLGSPHFESGFVSWNHPVLSAVEQVGLDVEKIYMTTAIKCAVKGNGFKIPHHVTDACIDEHLGPELELIQPGVIWLVGSFTMKMVQTHLRGCSVPKLKSGEVALVRAPSSWKYEQILIVRSHHPHTVLKGMQEYSELVDSVNLVKSYVEEGHVR